MGAFKFSERWTGEGVWAQYPLPSYCTSIENLAPRSGTSFHIGARGAPPRAGLPAYYINVKSRNDGPGPFNPGKIPPPYQSVQALPHLANLRRSMLCKEKIILPPSLYWAQGLARVPWPRVSSG